MSDTLGALVTKREQYLTIAKQHAPGSDEWCEAIDEANSIVSQILAAFEERKTRDGPSTATEALAALRSENAWLREQLAWMIPVIKRLPTLQLAPYREPLAHLERHLSHGS